MQKTFERTFDYIVILFFLLGISIPLLATLASPPRENSYREQRPLTHELDLEDKPLEEIPANFETFFNDQLGFRENIIFYNNLINVKFFDISPVDNVVIGRDGWLFLASGISRFRGLEPLSERDLELWKFNLETRQNTLRAYGIEYVLIIPPDKQTIYPEYLPSYYNQVSTITPLDQLLAYMTENSNVPIIDLRDVLLQEKESRQVFFQYDTHWNQWGGYLAYLELLNFIRSKFPNQTPEPVTITGERSRPRMSDLSKMVGLSDTLIESQSELIPNPFCTSITAPQHGEETETICPGQNLNLLVYHDSFFMAIAPFLSQSFHSVKYVSRNFDLTYQQLSSQPYPDILIEEFVERRLPFMPDTFWAELDFKQLHNVSTSLDASQPKYFQSIAIDSRSDGLHFTAQNTDPQIIYTIDRLQEGEVLGMFVDITVPEDTFLDIFYTGDGQPFSRQLMNRRAASAGRNQFYLIFPVEQDIDQIRIDPGNLLGNYVLHHFEVRTDRLSQVQDYERLPHEIAYLGFTNPQHLQFMTIESKTDGLHLATENTDPALIYAINEVPEGETLGIYLDIIVPDATFLDIFYVGGQRSFNPQERVRLSVAAGRNQLYLVFSTDQAIDQLRIDPGTVSGEYIIHKLEIRTTYSLNDEFEVLPHDIGFAGLSEPQRLQDVSSEFLSDGLYLTAQSNDPAVVYTIDAIPPGETVGVFLEVTAPENTRLDIFYTDEQHAFSAEKNISQFIEAGRNQLYLVFPTNQTVNQIRIDPGSVSGEYIIHELKIRSSQEGG